MFDPAKVKAKKTQKDDEAILLNQLRAWCYELVPIEYHMNLDIDIKEIECLDPECAPIDSVFTFVWGPGKLPVNSKGGLGIFSLPFSIKNLERSDLVKGFPDITTIKKWSQGEKAPWPLREQVQIRYEVFFVIISIAALLGILVFGVSAKSIFAAVIATGLTGVAAKVVTSRRTNINSDTKDASKLS